MGTEFVPKDSAVILGILGVLRRVRRMLVRSCRDFVPDVGQFSLVSEGDLTVNRRSHWSVRLVLLPR